MATERSTSSALRGAGPVRSLPGRPLHSALLAAFLVGPLGALVCTAARESSAVQAARPQATPQPKHRAPRMLSDRATLGLDVVSSSDVLLGTVADVLVLRAGTLLLALVEPAEVLNARGHLLPVPWEFLAVRPVDGERVVLRIDQEPIAMRGAPRVSVGNEPLWTQAAWLAELRDAYRSPLTGRRPVEASARPAPDPSALPRWWSLASLRGSVAHGSTDDPERTVALGHVHSLAIDLSQARVACLEIRLPGEGAAHVAAPWSVSPAGSSAERAAHRLVLDIDAAHLGSAPAWDVKELRGESAAVEAWLERVRRHYEQERPPELQR